MSSTFIEQDHPNRQPGYLPPRGLLPVPPAVRENVERQEKRILETHGFEITAEARRRMLNEATLDYYYRDQLITYRETPEGVEVLAVGLDEVGAHQRELSQEERLLITTRFI